MGQKTNPNILRLNGTKYWKSKYIEKKSSESATFAFQDLEIRKFIQRLLADNNLLLHSCQIHYLEDTLHIYLSYHITTKFSFIVKNKFKEKYVRPRSKKKNLTKQFRRKYFNLKQKTKNYFKYKETVQKYYKNQLINQFVRKNLSQKAKKLVKKTNFLLRYKRSKFISYHRLAVVTTLRNSGALKTMEISSFWNKIAESIRLFTKNSANILLHFKQLTKPTMVRFTHKQVKILKKVISQLRRYRRNEFFKKGLNIITTFIKTDQSSNLLAMFIADMLKKQKRHNFFLSFVKTAIKLMNQKSFTDPKGIKIKIKGKFNRAPRAKHRVIHIGRGVPVLSIGSNVDYSETTAFSSNGTFGVKVWTFNKTLPQD